MDEDRRTGDTVPEPARAGTGIEGLDHVLRGGVVRGRMHLVQGDPGSGKTTLGLSFLIAGAAKGERCLYIALTETEEEVRAVVRSHGLSLEGIDLYELSMLQGLREATENSIFHPSEVELEQVTQALRARVEALRPQRVVDDSLSEIRHLAQDPLRYRREILDLKQLFTSLSCTALVLDDRSQATRDLQVRSIVHGILELEQLVPEYGADRRRLRVIKLRESRYRGGYHDVSIVTGGLVVHPRLVAAEHHVPFSPDDVVKSGIAGLDELLGGGLSRGTSTLLAGPAGVGKSAVTTAFAEQLGEQGRRAALFLFDERPEILLARADGLGMKLEPMVADGRVTLRQIDPAELTPGEFVSLVKEAVDQGAELVGIDSLNGYLSAMQEERHLNLHLHELLSYLGQMGVTTLMVLAQHGMFGDELFAPADVSYLADSVLLLRYYEADGAVRKAISVVKKRTSGHETTIRDLRLSAGGITVGPPISQFRSVLSAEPVLTTPSEGDDGTG